MKIIVLNGTSTPIYEQIYKQVALQILDGTLMPDSPLPSIRNIAKEVGVSIITVKKAWELLEQSKLIYSQAGKGCFVSEAAQKNQQTTRVEVAYDQLKKDFPFYKKLGLTEGEFVELAKRIYKEEQ